MLLAFFIIIFFLWGSIVIFVYLMKHGLVGVYFIELLLSPIVDSDHHMWLILGHLVPPYNFLFYHKGICNTLS